MSLVKDHKKSTLFLILYFAWWFFVAYCYFVKDISTVPFIQNGIELFIIISLALTLIYALILLIMVFINSGDRQADFLIVFGIVASPLVMVLMYLITEA
jgi:uncharacterized integral membrane protein